MRYLLGIVAAVFLVAWVLLGAVGWAVLIASLTLFGGAVLGASLVIED
ncbi:MAG TPA: hypothetical protein VHF47_03760 [Acidimicrobiales bacterium]|nr:hypothetical protein [Acidimicrobiales bacterium]